MWTLCFLPCGFFFLSSSFVFPRLLSAVADWMSTILRHMVWPWWEFRMQAWNVLHAARWKYRTQKIAKNLPSVHHCTTFSGYIFAAKARIDNWKKVVKQQYLPHMSSQYGELGPLAAEISSVVFGHPCKFQLVSHLGFVTAATSLNGSQPNFARRLAVSWADTLYIHFWELLPLSGIVPAAKITLRPSLAFSYIGSITARHSSSGRQLNFVAWYYGIFTEGATYIRLGGHHVGHRPTF